MKNEFKPTPGPWTFEDPFENGGLSVAIDYDVPGGGSPIILGCTK